ncbi:carboxypeptidase regulatory-like domain-containing protein [Candidatus Chloroploca sp. M-50]|uniref:Carboxypeptidase regulatory-like domain-containing protein n=1 Tax=Candidatus Chloroploca mongolica TaxID=2528176 RepID=A0ABS4DFB9_9CHLR|nr:carboxypeptidase-like regulatory domain-containing protein [Candidatus Chloroploca mongolica]MBP1468120.1 carboxypeptidase regulatory-like domain-containing protein [Candidatus Chloroploca mongolica]
MQRHHIRVLLTLCALLLIATLLPQARGLVEAQSSLATTPSDPAPFARLAGTASPDGLAQAGLRVELAQDGVRPEATTTDGDGAYFFAMVAGGAYTVTAFDGTGLPFASETLLLTSGETLYVDLGEPLRPRRASLANNETSPCAYNAPPGTAIIRGTVTDALTGQPVSDVFVSAFGPRNASATTSATGTYTLTELAAGAYRISFRPPSSQNYLLQYYNGKDDSAEADLLTVPEGATLTNINAALTPGAIISGRVSGVGNEALSGVAVTAYRLVGEARYAEASDRTESDGSFSIDRLPAGTYQLETWITDSDNATVRAYLNGTSNEVSIAPSSTNPNVNLNLVRGAQFSGRITDANGSGISDIRVTVYDATNDRYVKDVARSEFNGSYTSLALPAGSYKVRFWSNSYASQVYLDTYYNNQPSLELATPLVLGASGVTPNIDAQLTLGGVIAGKVTGANGVPLNRVSVWAGPAAGGSGSYVSTSTGSDGTYTLRGLATGQYQVSFATLDSYDTETQRYLGEYYNNQSTSATANPVTVTAPNTVANINAELTRGAIISGCVSGSDTGRGISRPRLEIRPVGGGSSVATRSDSNGTYRTQALLPGSYRITFSDDSTSNNSTRPGYVSQDYATPVVVASDSLTGIDAVLNPGGAFRGTITGLDGVPLDGIDVSIYTPSSYVARGSTYEDGVYTTRTVAPGRYTLRLRPYSSSPSAAYASVEIGPFDATLNAFTIVNYQMSLGGQISGRITNRDGAALSDLSVAIYNEAGYFVDSTYYVDDSGVYTTTGLAPGNYRLEFRPYGDANQYAPQFYNNKPDLASADPVTVSEPGIIPNINAALDIGSVIAGQVTVAGGAELGAVEVAVYNAEGRYIRTTWVASDGSYSTPALASGSYRLCFTPQASRLIAECYNNQATPDNATPIVVTAPTPVENINVELAVGSQLKGRVVDAAGDGVAGVQVVVVARTSTAQENLILARAFSASDGSYTTSPGLPAGAYQLSFYAPTGSNLGFANLDATVASSGTDVELADVTLSSVRRVYLPLVWR